ncbi:hypothetical protein SAMN05216243_0415 [Sediminibacillus albus]|uniref:Uncharacterized protein n=1 Tax=Sediminibacillus albus TaxID=407036 RepID=A0A1G8VX37_9BACI|nr:hypothetical protein SAMN05216243_0415 [Sediminibacillus albus]
MFQKLTKVDFFYITLFFLTLGFMYYSMVTS